MAIPEHFSWPLHFKVAKIIAACLPGAVMDEKGEGKERYFVYFCEGKQILEIDRSGWTYGFEAKGGTWRSFLEGSYETIAKYILGPLVDIGIQALKPPSKFDFENPPVITEVLQPRARRKGEKRI